jgi:hypothetical protein
LQQPTGGVTALSSSGQAATTILLRNVVASYNFVGLVAEGTNATLSVAHSVVTGNTHAGVSTFSGGIMNSYGDNDIDGNFFNDNTGVLTPLAMH